MKKSNSHPALIAPSLLSAHFDKLADELKDVEQAGADALHLDVMDGHFVPNLTFGPILVEAIRKSTRLIFDCHLMVSNPEQWVEPFAKAGADWITVHAESTHHLDRLLNRIKELKCKAGVAINPGTSLVAVEEVLDQVDLVLLMSVNPGFGGQRFIESTKRKIESLNRLRGKRSFMIGVDGGVGSKNIAELRKLGADLFVVGSAVFSASNRKSAIADLRKELKD